jgi:PAS domain S-box-containing protein
MEERPQSDEGPFLGEKRDLIDAIGERLGKIADCIKAERTLRESEKKFKYLVEATSDWIWECDKEGLYTYASPKVKSLLGYEVSEVLCRTPFDLMPEEERVKIGKFFKEKLAKKEAFYGLENTCRHKDGHLVIIETSAVPVFDEDGRLKGYRGIDRDITERKKAEETQKRLVAIIEATPDFVGFADAKDKHIIYVNKAGRKMCGIGNDEDVTKLKISDVHPEWTNKMLAEEILPAAVRDGVWTGECAFLNIRDRHEMPVLMVLSSHKASNGEVEVFSTISRDITERKQAEEALRESEERYKNLFKANVDGILIADATTKKFRYANPAICRMLGYSEEELTQMGVADIHPKESLEQVAAEFEAQTSGAKITADLQCVRKDGQVISVSINAGTVMIDQTKYLLGIFRDITERKNKEKQILDANQRLEKVSEELSAAKRDLEQKNEALQKTCSELQQRVKEQTAALAAASRSLGDKGYYK